MVYSRPNISYFDFDMIRTAVNYNICIPAFRLYPFCGGFQIVFIAGISWR